MSEPWHVDALEVGEPAELLDRSAALLDRLASDPTPTLRWYRSATTAIVRGRGQRRVHLRAQPGTVEVTRGSGGGAVLLDPTLLSLDIALPAEHPWVTPARDTHGPTRSPDPTGVFVAVGERWRVGLAGLGVQGLGVCTDPPPRPRGDERADLLASVCFALPGHGEVYVGARKLVGLAQRRRRHGVLVQCGLLRRWDPAPLLRALGASATDPEVHAAAVGLDEVTDPPPSDAEVIAAVSTAMGAASADVRTTWTRAADP